MFTTEVTTVHAHRAQKMNGRFHFPMDRYRLKCKHALEFPETGCASRDKMKITEDVKECIRRLFSAFVREKQRRAPEYSYEHPIFRIAAALQLPRPTVYGIVSQSGTGCNSVILLRPKIGVEPPKHDVISMPTQQYTNTNYISLERSHLVVSIMLRYVDRIKTFNDNLSCREVKIDKKFWGDLPYFALKCDKFL